jgi:enoyl-CoA hydratase
MACSLRLTSDNALFDFPRVGIGTIPGYGGTQRLPRLVGKGKALEMLLTGDPIDAKEAYRIGLVNQITPVADPIPTANKVARRIMRNGPVSLGMGLSSVNHGKETSLDLECYMKALDAAVLTSTEDMKEGAQAFLEKRKLRLQGK